MNQEQLDSRIRQTAEKLGISQESARDFVFLSNLPESEAKEWEQAFSDALWDSPQEVGKTFTGLTERGRTWFKESLYFQILDIYLNLMERWVSGRNSSQHKAGIVKDMLLPLVSGADISIHRAALRLMVDNSCHAYSPYLTILQNVFDRDIFKKDLNLKENYTNGLQAAKLFLKMAGQISHPLAQDLVHYSYRNLDGYHWKSFLSHAYYGTIKPDDLVENVKRALENVEFSNVYDAALYCQDLGERLNPNHPVIAAEVFIMHDQTRKEYGKDFLNFYHKRVPYLL